MSLTFSSELLKETAQFISVRKISLSCHYRFYLHEINTLKTADSLYISKICFHKAILGINCELSSYLFSFPNSLWEATAQFPYLYSFLLLLIAHNLHLYPFFLFVRPTSLLYCTTQNNEFRHNMLTLSNFNKANVSLVFY